MKWYQLILYLLGGAIVQLGAYALAFFLGPMMWLNPSWDLFWITLGVLALVCIGSIPFAKYQHLDT